TKDILTRGEQFLEESNKAWKVYQALPQTPEEKLLSDDVEKKRSEYISNGLQAMIKAVRDGNAQQADALVMAGILPASRALEAS
ncbi:Tar ligand binding domain-containing protein, partial [Pseudomonas poae]|uniref:Tar ligand binding domain-containing protein n=1 Tax=Pseudomonas poae TaxID=200451 RepID=UPI0034D55805